MYTVSDAYKTDMAGLMRGESTVEVAHILPNYHNSVIDAGTVFPNGLMDNEVNEYFNSQVQGATFEPSGCLLDGTYYLRGNTNEVDEYVYPLLSGTTGTVTGHSYEITLTGVDADTVPEGIFILFDSKEVVKPTSLTITMKTSLGVTLGSPVTYVDGTDYSGFRAQLDLPDITGSESSLGKIVINVNSLNIPYAYVRFEKVILGTVNEFGDDIIVACDWDVASDPLTFNIPKADFSFTFLDPENEYHESNPDSKFDDIVENQQVGFRFGYTLNGGGVEWVQGGLYRTTGEKSVSEGIIPQVTIKCRHASVSADELIKEFDLGAYVSLDDTTEAPISIDNIATLLGYIGVDVTIDSYNTEANFVDTATMVDSKYTLKEYLQIISNAYGLMWTVDRGVGNTEDIVLREFAKLKMRAEHSYDSETLDLFDNNLFDGYYLFQFNNNNTYDLPKIKSVPKSDGIDFANYNHITSATDRTTYRPDGGTGVRLVKIDNPFVTSKFVESQTGVTNDDIEPNKNFHIYIGDYYKEQKSYVIVNRGYPELDVGDIVHLYIDYYKDDPLAEDGVSIEYTLSKRCIVVENKIMYGGTLSGETTLIEWEEVLAKDYSGV